MAVLSTGQAPAAQDKLVINNDCDETSDNNVFSSSATLYSIRIENPHASAVAFVKLYDNVAPTVGTTDPDIILSAPADKVITWVMQAGVSMDSVSMACVSTAGRAGTTTPTGTIDVRLTAK